MYIIVNTMFIFLYLILASANCELLNTIMFVAFDFEEQGLVGSEKFVQNLTMHLQRTNGTINGAFILETTINHNSSAGNNDTLDDVCYVDR